MTQFPYFWVSCKQGAVQFRKQLVAPIGDKGEILIKQIEYAHFADLCGRE